MGLSDIIFYFELALPICAGFLTQALTGLGGGLISIPIMGLIIPPEQAVGIVALFQVSMGVMVIPLFKETLWREVIKLAPVIIISSALGAFTLTIFSGEWIKIILATYIFFELYRQIFVKQEKPLMPGIVVYF
jgi:uncharacterized membrane protein YfcA